MTEADCMNTTCTHGAPICEMHEHAEENGRCKCHAPEGKSDLMQSEWCCYLGQTLSNARIQTIMYTWTRYFMTHVAGHNFNFKKNILRTGVIIKLTYKRVCLFSTNQKVNDPCGQHI